jgi:pimeloyl-ACP methyl ester carboxylesterase
MVNARVAINGVDTYYVREGSGEPVLLLHGAFSNSDDMAPYITGLSSHYDVIAYDRRGHGRTSDVDGPLTYDVMAEDALALLDALGVPKAHVVGYSDGANVGMIMAIRAPDRVGRFVSMSGNFHTNGLTDEARATFADPPAALLDMLEAGYARLSPDGKAHFPIVVEKTQRMILNEPQLTTNDLSGISCPTLVMCADDDMIRLDHTIEIHRAVAGSQLCVMPGASHLFPFETPARVLLLLREFLAGVDTKVHVAE